MTKREQLPKNYRHDLRDTPNDELALEIECYEKYRQVMAKYFDETADGAPALYSDLTPGERVAWCAAIRTAYHRGGTDNGKYCELYVGC